VVRDFAQVVKHARKGDFVYFDPPYVPLSDTSAFTSYAAGGFGPEDQQRLGEVVGELSKKGVLVMLSNSDTPAVRAIYGGYRMDIVTASRSINSRATGRGKVREVVVRNY
jgi:DNA adenine methylase